MKRIAVIGFKKVGQFNKWAYDRIHNSKSYRIEKGYAVDDENNTAYHLILGEGDIHGLSFDEIIECDPLRWFLRLRLKKNK